MSDRGYRMSSNRIVSFMHNKYQCSKLTSSSNHSIIWQNKLIEKCVIDQLCDFIVSNNLGVLCFVCKSICLIRCKSYNSTNFIILSFSQRTLFFSFRFYLRSVLCVFIFISSFTWFFFSLFGCFVDTHTHTHIHWHTWKLKSTLERSSDTMKLRGSESDKKEPFHSFVGRVLYRLCAYLYIYNTCYMVCI